MILLRLTVLLLMPFLINAASFTSTNFSVSIARDLIPVFFDRLSQNFVSASFSNSITIAFIILVFDCTTPKWMNPSDKSCRVNLRDSLMSGAVSRCLWSIGSVSAAVETRQNLYNFFYFIDLIKKSMRKLFDIRFKNRGDLVNRINSLSPSFSFRRNHYVALIGVNLFLWHKTTIKAPTGFQWNGTHILMPA
jgi:hypothetical protein